MGGRPYPSTSEVTWTQPRREEWPCPGSRGRHASWRQCSAQHSAARHSWQRHTAKLASTRKHAAHSIAEQSKTVYHNNGGGLPHHLPQAPTPAQHPTPTTRALHPRKATAACKQGTRASLKGRPRGLGLGPANGWAALSKRFGSYLNSASTGRAALPGYRHASRRQRSAQRGGNIAHNTAQHTKAGRGTQRNTLAHDNTQHTTQQSKAK